MNRPSATPGAVAPGQNEEGENETVKQEEPDVCPTRA